jgi:hypothetical protein
MLNRYSDEKHKFHPFILVVMLDVLLMRLLIEDALRIILIMIIGMMMIFFEANVEAVRSRRSFQVVRLNPIIDTEILHLTANLSRRSKTVRDVFGSCLADTMVVVVTCQ